MGKNKGGRKQRAKDELSASIPTDMITEDRDDVEEDETHDVASGKSSKTPSAPANALKKSNAKEAKKPAKPLQTPPVPSHEIKKIAEQYRKFYDQKYERRKSIIALRVDQKKRRGCCPKLGMKPWQIVLLTLIAVFAWMWYLNAHDVIEEAGGIKSFAAQTIPMEIQLHLNNLGINFTASSEESAERPSLPLVGKLLPYHPVMMVPGVVTTGLEIWGGAPCAVKNFRQRLWGHLSMMQQLVADRSCWLEHIMLNKSTGLDPEGVKLRSAQGLEAADYLFPGYWVWGKMIQNFADLGYDSNNLFMASYDWRLSVRRLEKRDHYFTKMKWMIELSLHINQHKMVVLTHSMGTNVFLYFMNWVEQPTNLGGGGGGEGWINKHIQAFVNIAGPVLGVPKAVPSLLSGEMRDTAQLGQLNTYLLDNFFSKKQRSDMFRSWGSIPIMFPKGGNRIWGTETWSADALDAGSYITLSLLHDNAKPQEQFDGKIKPSPYSKWGEVTYVNNTASHLHGRLIVNITADKVWDFIVDETKDEEWAAFYNTVYSHGVPPSKDIFKQNDGSMLNKPKYWTNPLESMLPKAPNMTMYCFYGVGKEAERAYMYKTRSDVEDGDVGLEIDYTVTNADQGLLFGVQSGEGDGTVPLLSLGYMCTEGWTNPKYPYNPAKIPIITREYEHKPSSIISDLRGGPATADHVDIMGNWEMTVDILKIVTGQVGKAGKERSDATPDAGEVEGTVEPRILSKIKDYSRHIKLFG